MQFVSFMKARIGMVNLDSIVGRARSWILVVLLLVSCSPRAPSNIPDAHQDTQRGAETTSLPTKSPSTEVAEATPLIPCDPPECLEQFESHELRDPYRPSGEPPRYTFSQTDFYGYLNQMGIETVCIPAPFGSPYLIVDWNSQDHPATITGRMVIIGFEGLRRGGGWGEGYLVYATYDFAVGSEYEVFAIREDYEAFQADLIPNRISVHGVDGFIRLHAGIPMGMQEVYKTYIFPFETHHIAVVMKLGAYDPLMIDQVMGYMRGDQHPATLQSNVFLLDLFVSSIIFQVEEVE